MLAAVVLVAVALVVALGIGMRAARRRAAASAWSTSASPPSPDWDSAGSMRSPRRPSTHGGLGIGLSLVQGIVELHGGSVEARSAGPGKGSEFIVRLPLPPAEAPIPPQPPAPARSPASGVRVLVADDNRDAADTLHRILALYGYDVRVAYDGVAAIELACAFRPRVAVLDLGMPGASGFEVARAMRERCADGTTLIALTGWGQEGDRRRAMEAGFDFHLTKPVDPGVLNDLLAEISSE